MALMKSTLGGASNRPQSVQRNGDRGHVTDAMDQENKEKFQIEPEIKG